MRRNHTRKHTRVKEVLISVTCRNLHYEYLNRAKILFEQEFSLNTRSLQSMKKYGQIVVF